VVGLVDNGNVYIGVDSAAVKGYETRVLLGPKKIFRAGEFLIGFTTSFRMGQILEHHLSVRPQGDESDFAYMVTAFAEGVRDSLKDHGYSEIDNNRESGGTLLVGYRGHLYKTTMEFAILEGRDGFDAIGCGEDYALGVLYVLGELSPEARITAGLEAAAYFSGNVCPPFYSMSLRGDE